MPVNFDDGLSLYRAYSQSYPQNGWFACFFSTSYCLLLCHASLPSASSSNGFADPTNPMTEECMRRSRVTLKRTSESYTRRRLSGVRRRVRRCPPSLSLSLVCQSDCLSFPFYSVVKKNSSFTFYFFFIFSFLFKWEDMER